jgi:hypothetical protein
VQPSLSSRAPSQPDLFALPREVQVDAARRLADRIAVILGEPIRLLVHDNRSTMVSFRREEGRLHYRVHHMFLDAPEPVVSALAHFAGPARATRRRAAGRQIDAYVRLHRARIGAPKPPRRLRSRGRHHDLQAIYDRLNADHFAGVIDARIGWGVVRFARRKRTIKTGVYVQDARLIRIHPALDRREVPEYYVAAVVFHEMLHQAVPAIETGGRHVVHHREFRERERAYPDHGRAKSWEESHLSLLLAPG